jgi:protein arginine kinase activator
MSFKEFQKTGLLGCASCYDVFKKELMPYIERIQGKTVHVGLKGGDYYTEHELRRRLKDMQDELEGALKRGDYIYAGKLNARMQAIKKQLTGGTKNE